MRKHTLRAAITAALVLPATAAAAPTRQHARQYERAYHAVAHKLGRRAPGRDIVRNGTSRGTPSDAQVVRSLGVLRRMLTPAPAATAVASDTVATGLTQCIIGRESGGNAQAVNSSGHMGEGQWDESTWLADGGGQYGATPLDASPAEQEQVIASQVAAGNTGQWTAYDGC